MDKGNQLNIKKVPNKTHSESCSVKDRSRELDPGKINKTALTDSEERLKAILETAVEGIITIDDHGLIESANRAAENIFGYKATEMIGHKVNMLMPPPFSREHDEYLSAYRHTGQKKIIGIGRKVLGKRKNGDVFPLDLAVSEVRLSGRTLFTGFIRDISERVELEKEIVKISEAEQRRIGQDLHDGVCQHLAGIEFMSQVLEQKISKRSKEGAESAAEIARLVREAIKQTRDVARGLSPLSLEAGGLMSALDELAETTGHRFRVQCQFNCPKEVLLENSDYSTHLYRIAQEAISNAVRHGRSAQIRIGLHHIEGNIVLQICDNGKGFNLSSVVDSPGMGIKIMRYRAQMMGAILTHEPSNLGGTCVKCILPTKNPIQPESAHDPQI